jgi:hypothetical protein
MFVKREAYSMQKKVPIFINIYRDLVTVKTETFEKLSSWVSTFKRSHKN